MAVDTRDKRASAVGLTPWLLQGPTPDAAFSQADRQQIAFTYRGILATDTSVSVYPDPFAATATAALDPFAATSRYKGT